MAFENSNCLDYVTEKFFNALRVFYSIPIVIKRDIYTQLGVRLNRFNLIVSNLVPAAIIHCPG